MAQPQGNPKQIDPSTVPPAVRRAAEEAERLQKEQIERQQQARGEPAPGGEPAPIEPEPPKQEGAPAPTNPEPPKQEGAPAPTNPEPPKQGDPDPNADSWKVKFESEQGRTRKLREDVSNLSTQVSELRSVLATMQAPPAQAPAPEMRFERLITPEEEKEWGPEFMQVVEKKAKEIVAPLQAELNAKLEQLNGRVEQSAEMGREAARAAMFRTLDTNERIKGWRDINTDPDFVAWLQYPDRLSGIKRHDMITQAFNSNDASRVAAFFEDFLREVAAVAPQQGQPRPQTNGAGKPSLDQFAAPGRASHVATPANPGAQDQKPFIKRSDIAKFFAEKQAGRWRGREKEADDFEAAIFAANREGRVVDG